MVEKILEKTPAQYLEGFDLAVSKAQALRSIFEKFNDNPNHLFTKILHINRLGALHLSPEKYFIKEFGFDQGYSSHAKKIEDTLALLQRHAEPPECHLYISRKNCPIGWLAESLTYLHLSAALELPVNSHFTVRPFPPEAFCQLLNQALAKESNSLARIAPAEADAITKELQQLGDTLQSIYTSHIDASEFLEILAGTLAQADASPNETPANRQLRKSFMRVLSGMVQELQPTQPALPIHA